ncbi:uncharacterized protein LOC133852149 [Alnus glutinosa]|uniref:uncharacterized protein LOC133852149 n=1 Tax=Alnus glutinosa TaxID=3517 RepID=UPI002D79E6FF|nr:uncharacterized protein LOC133852149 [Alnus glutinosa]
MFVKMPTRNPFVGIEQPKSLRRSQRFLNHKTTTEPQRDTTLRKSPRLHPKNTTSEPEDRKTPKSKSKNHRARSPGPLLSSAQDKKDCPGKDSKKTSKSDIGTRNVANLCSGSRRSPRLNNGVEGSRSLRRSPRFSNQQKFVEECTDYAEKVSEKTRKSDIGLSSGGLSFGSSKSPSSNCSIEGVEGLRRSQRVSNQRNVVDKHVEKSGSAKSSDKVDLTDVGKAEYIVGKRERQTKGSSIGPEAFMVKGKERKAKEIGVEKKRKRDEEDSGLSKGWTKEQELALQRAYFAAKPTPHFWKKVSKLVPGKSKQECFDKVHSENLTPLQPRPRSRSKKAKSSPLQHVSLSASRLLKPRIKMLRCKKQRTHLAQKTVRHLLQKHNHVDQEYEADLFSVLEPNMDPSAQAFQPGVILSTPKRLQEEQGFLQKPRERSSSSRKKSLSRFSGSSLTSLVSPPVLKQVKNRVLHEKYIDQLHCREAKRRVASARAEKSFVVKEDTKDHVQKIDVVKAAKNALESEARCVISQYQLLQANALSNSDFNDDDGVDSNDHDDSDDGI